MYEFIENITDALRGDLGLFNKYLAFINVDNTRVDYNVLDLPSMPVARAPLPGLAQS